MTNGFTPFTLIGFYAQECYPFFSNILCHHLATRTLNQAQILNIMSRKKQDLPQGLNFMAAQ